MNETPTKTGSGILRATVSIALIATGSMMLCLSVTLIRAHFQALKDVREYALPMAADIPPLEQRKSILNEQTELSALESSLRNDSAQEKLNVYVLPQGEDLQRLLAFLESSRTFLERRGLLQSMSPIDAGGVTPMTFAASGEIAQNLAGTEQLQSRTLTFNVTLKPEGRTQLLTILKLSGMLTVGDTLSPENIRKLFNLTESQNYAGIVPVEQFLSADLLTYLQDPRLYDERLSQALASEEFLKEFKGVLKESSLPQTRELLTGDLGRALVAQKLWPIQFVTIEKETVTEKPEGWETVELSLKAYSRKKI